MPGAQSFGRTIALLDLIAEAPSPPRFSDLLASSGLAKATLHRMLSALAAQGLARQGGDGAWRLGPRLLSLAHRAWAGFDLRDAAREDMRRLAELWRGTVHLAVPEGSEALIVDLAEGQAAYRLPFGIGRRLKLHASALGKALLAFAPPPRRAALLDGLGLPAATGRTLTAADALDLALDLAVARGYALDDEEVEEGIRCVAAPIRDHTGAPVGAISLSLPAFRADLDRLHAAARDVVDAARRIAGNTGAVPAFSIQAAPRPDAPPTPGLAVLPGISCLVGEAPLWRDDALLLVDLLAPALWRDGPAPERVDLDDIVSCLVPRRGGGVIAAGRRRVGVLDPVSGRIETRVTVEAGAGHRINDGGCDAAGRLWLGTMAIDAAPGEGALWRIGPDGRAERMDAGLGVPNGIAWSPDGAWMYLADSRARTLWRYPFDPGSGAIGARTALARFGPQEGNPAGLAVDEAGGIWTCLWDGWRAVRLLPEGGVARSVVLPVPRPASLAFIGKRRDRLVITTARVRLPDAALAAAPLSGRIFTLEAGMRGRPPGDAAL